MYSVFFGKHNDHTIALIVGANADLDQAKADWGVADMEIGGEFKSFGDALELVFRQRKAATAKVVDPGNPDYHVGETTYTNMNVDNLINPQ